jgi:hypothetical protein
MKVWQFTLALALLVAVSIAAVWQQVRIIRAGYRLAGLAHDRDRLVEQKRRLTVRRAREARIDALLERARKLGIEIPGEEKPEAGRE